MQYRLCRRAAFLAVAGLLLSATARADADGELIAAAGRGHLPDVRKLLAGGASVKARDPRGRTALLAATHGNHLQVARVLIEAGADVNAKDDAEDSPFLYAGAEGRLEILKMTIAAGADLKSTNRYGGTALIPAAHHGHVEAVKVLLATRIDVDHVRGDGGPIHTEIVRLLVAAGANVDLADRERVTPLAHAQRRGYAGMARILRAAGAR
jgi:uncharacterized protein